MIKLFWINKRKIRLTHFMRDRCHILLQDLAQKRDQLKKAYEQKMADLQQEYQTKDQELTSHTESILANIGDSLLSALNIDAGKNVYQFDSKFEHLILTEKGDSNGNTD